MTKSLEIMEKLLKILLGSFILMISTWLVCGAILAVKFVIDKL